MNTVSLIGCLTADPQSRNGDSHQCTAFRLAVSRPGSDAADFVDIVTFDALAKTVADDKPADWPALGRYRKRTA